MPRIRVLVLWTVLLFPCSTRAKVPASVLDALKNNPFEALADPEVSDIPVPVDDAGEIAEAVWRAYQREQSTSPQLAEADRLQVIRRGNQVMRYSVSTIGQPGAYGYPLYIALHGGGTAPAAINDGQWEHMKTYYRSSINDGIYVAPRAISNTWDMHFQPASYELYKQLIAQMVLLHNVDPDRVYLLGFSAGGDGVYQVAPRISDRLAAANMSAGHPNGVSLINLRHVPMLLQVGEQDYAYNRNRVTAEYDAKLSALHNAGIGGWVHETFVHAGKGHNFYDNDPRHTPQAILDPQAWLQDGNRVITSRNTNAVAWLSGFRRNPLPKELIWDLSTVVPAQEQEGPLQHHWLDIGNSDAAAGTVLRARIDTESNTIFVQGAKSYLKIWLNHTMIDLHTPVRIVMEKETRELRLSANMKHQVQSILIHGDPRRVFDATVELRETAQGWDTTAP